MKLLVATRKGLFVLRDSRIEKPHFLGDPVTAVLQHDGSLYAALNLGHFGVKMRRSGGMNSAYMPCEAIFQVSPPSRVCQAPPQEMPTVMRRLSRGSMQMEWMPGWS